MDLVGLAITIVAAIAIIALIQWAWGKMPVKLPQPVLIVLYAIIVIVAIIYIARFAGLASSGPTVLVPR